MRDMEPGKIHDPDAVTVFFLRALLYGPIIAAPILFVIALIFERLLK